MMESGSPMACGLGRAPHTPLNPKKIMEKKMETTIMGYLGYRIWGIWESYYNIPKAIFYLSEGDYNPKPLVPSAFDGPLYSTQSKVDAGM